MGARQVVLRRFDTEQEACNYRYLAQQIYPHDLFVAEMADECNPGNWAVYYLRTVSE